MVDSGCCVIAGVTVVVAVGSGCCCFRCGLLSLLLLSLLLLAVDVFVDVVMSAVVLLHNAT